MKPRLLIVTSHPIQYQVPWFRALHEDGRIELKVLFLSLPDVHDQGVGFGNVFAWDVPLLDGYDWQLAPSARGGIRDGWWGLRLHEAAADLAVQNADAVLLTGWQNLGLLQCLRAARRMGLPILLRAESNGLAPLSTPRHLKNRWIVGHADCLLSIGQANRRFYEALGFKQRIGPAVPYGVDNRFFAERCEALQAQRPQLRRHFDIPESALCFLFAGKLVAKKRPGDLLVALSGVRDIRNHPVHVLIAGTGPLEPVLREQVLREELPVSFAGFLNQTEIPAAYAAADCLVLPSDYGETWGLVVNEAMACGLPAIVSDRVGCGPDLVLEGETGFTFHCGGIEGLAASMSVMVDMDPESRAAMGKAAQQRVFRDYSIERAVENTVSATLEFASTGARRASH